MKVMVIGKATKDSEAGVMAPDAEEKWKEMGRFNEELIEAGILVAAYGLHPSSKGVRVHSSGNDHVVMDGPFAEIKELIAGFMIWEVPSMAEAIAWVKRSPMTGDCDVEIRPIFSPEDIGEAVSPEIQKEVEDRWAKVAARDKKFRPPLVKTPRPFVSHFEGNLPCRFSPRHAGSWFSACPRC